MRLSGMVYRCTADAEDVDSAGNQRSKSTTRKAVAACRVWCGG